ncbi:MAG: hypothetical protein C0483_23795 [Pirellula sp.]|nr:hypothetical protein [Pirellula sp.]
MMHEAATSCLPVIDTSSGVAPAGAATDERLLAQFLAAAKLGRRDDASFAELVARHGPMVLGVCRRTLGNQQDAEDAFQASFLVLARKARSLRTARSLPAWLYQTAYRIALRARAARAKRREMPLENEAMIAPDTLAQIAHDYEQSLVDDELDRLPEKYRLPVFLCCLEGKSLDEAAGQLGWSLGSVKGRLERGRQELRRRLMLRRGAPAVAVALVACLPKTASAAVAVPASLAASTVQAGVSYAAGHGTLGMVSQHALSLADGSTRLMSAAATKFAACSALTIGLLAWGGSHLPAPARAGGGSGPKNVIELQTSVPATQTAAGDLSGVQIAFAGDGDAPRTGPREGDQPRTGPREGDQPRTGAREGDAPRSSLEGAAREGAPREGAREGAREGVSREGAREGQQRDPLMGFQPANQREAVLLQMIMQLRAEVAQLRTQVQGRSTTGVGMRDGAREGATGTADGVRKAGVRDGEANKAGLRDGEKPRTGVRDGEGAVKKTERDN